MVCIGNEQRSFYHFWDCTQVLHFGLFFFFFDYEGYLNSSKEFFSTIVDIMVLWIKYAHSYPFLSFRLVYMCYNLFLSFCLYPIGVFIFKIDFLPIYVWFSSIHSSGQKTSSWWEAGTATELASYVSCLSWIMLPRDQMWAFSVSLDSRFLYSVLFSSRRLHSGFFTCIRKWKWCDVWPDLKDDAFCVLA